MGLEGIQGSSLPCERLVGRMLCYSALVVKWAGERFAELKTMVELPGKLLSTVGGAWPRGQPQDPWRPPVLAIGRT